MASHHGVVTAIPTDTGKCLDTEVLSNICHGCIRWQKEDQLSDSYLKWKADHKCAANLDGTASSMESVGAARMFMWNEFQHDLRYVNYLGDGDSSSFKSVQECRPYGDECPITKMECTGHVQNTWVLGCGNSKRRTKERSFETAKVCVVLVVSPMSRPTPCRTTLVWPFDQIWGTLLVCRTT